MNVVTNQTGDVTIDALLGWFDDPARTPQPQRRDLSGVPKAFDLKRWMSASIWSWSSSVFSVVGEPAMSDTPKAKRKRRGPRRRRGKRASDPTSIVPALWSIDQPSPVAMWKMYMDDVVFTLGSVGSAVWARMPSENIVSGSFNIGPSVDLLAWIEAPVTAKREHADAWIADVRFPEPVLPCPPLRRSESVRVFPPRWEAEPIDVEALSVVFAKDD